MTNMNFIKQNPGIDFFSGDRKFAEHVSNFMINFVWKAEMREKYGAEKSKLENLVAIKFGLENTILEYQIEEKTEAANARIAEIDKEIENVMAQYPFEYSDADKALKKALDARSGKVTMAKVKGALIAWYKSYGFDVNGNTYIVKATLESMGLKFNMNTFIESKATNGMVFDGATAYKNAWHIAYTYGVKAGIIKKTMIPPMLQAKYDAVQALKEAKKAEKEAKKAQKNAEKKAKTKASADDKKRQNERTKADSKKAQKKSA